MKTFAISFFVRSDRIDSENRVPVFMRITVDGKRANVALNRKISEDKWDSGTIKGNSKDAKELKKVHAQFGEKIEAIQRDLLDRGEPVTAELLKASPGK